MERVNGKIENEKYMYILYSNTPIYAASYGNHLVLPPKLKPILGQERMIT